MTLQVDAMEKLTYIKQEVLRDDYDGYDGESREGEVTEEMATVGIGKCGPYDIPERLRA